uniref:Fungal lipase-like domain-containing protein n=1 Tax=Panagrolaimus sp. ES5 TaxID=591445 RepID=A0AC34G0U2_9BILA
MVNFVAAAFIESQIINNTNLANQYFEKSYSNGKWEKFIHYSIKPCAGYFNGVCQVIITRSTPLNMVVIAFRGTVEKDQMSNKADTTLIDFVTWPYNASFGRVNKYFFAASESLWNNYIESTIKENEGYTIAFSGHSIGGAIATLTALKARHLGLVDDNKMKLYTFGEPRIGDYEFANNFQSLISQSYRIVHDSGK